jgi:hypothetical protein
LAIGIESRVPLGDSQASRPDVTLAIPTHPRVLIRAERTQRLDRLSLQRLVIAMPYTTQFNNAYYLGIKLPRLAFIKGRGCEATEV